MHSQRIRTRVFDLAAESGFDSNRALADAMGIHESQVSRVRRGESEIGTAFITGARRAFPDKSLDELFTIEADGDEEPVTAPKEAVA